MPHHHCQHVHNGVDGPCNVWVLPNCGHTLFQFGPPNTGANATQVRHSYRVVPSFRSHPRGSCYRVRFPQVTLHHSPPLFLCVCVMVSRASARPISSPRILLPLYTPAQWGQSTTNNTLLHRRVKYHTGRPVRPVQRQESEVKLTGTAKDPQKAKR